MCVFYSAEVFYLVPWSLGKKYIFAIKVKKVFLVYIHLDQCFIISLTERKM